MRNFLLSLAFAGAAMAQDFPQAEIGNGLIQAKLYLPDAERGYYRGTRFDWSGVIYSLRYKGHEFFGQWFPRYDPKLHDAIMGPVEEFRTDNAGLGYDEAKPGGTFIRIGVGVVRKPEEPAYRPFNTYDIVDPGKWAVRKGPDWIEFTHELKDENGYAYTYRKTVRLAKDKPELILEHELKNTGRRAIDTTQYNHNFFVIDGQPTGPDTGIGFAFEPHPASDFKNLAEVRGHDIVYARELAKGESVFSELSGFGDSAADYNIRIENRKAKAGVRITGDRPLQKVVFWSINTVACPEPYVEIKVEPGQSRKWNITYDFFAQ